MGYSVLYVAFGIVALWLLGEVLLQYKARLRWRLLAFTGFMGVVGGVALRQVVVIVLGALAFGAGQSLVTLSYKRGFSTGWAVGGRPGSSRRRRGHGAAGPEPVLEVGPVEPESAAAGATGIPGSSGAAGAATARERDAEVLAAQRAIADESETSVFQPVPMHDDSGEYPLYDGQSSYTPDPYTSGGYEGYGAQGYPSWNGEPHPAAAGYDQQQSGWGSGQAYVGQGYGYEQGQGGYQDQQQPAAASYDGYGNGYGGYDTYGPQAGGTGDWTPQPHPQHTEPAHQGGPSGPSQQGDGYGYGAYDSYDPQAQPYIPQQQNQSPYEQHAQQPQHDQHSQHDQQPQHDQHAQPQYTAEPSEYADPYDPYRY
ncbi:hypothetical protein [Streptomyces sp. NBC_01190]|uniref:hypothetical protein n=1 Tax=Streptomyces sp. NBC_01190 TaxID=2903767 RepID=UPI00386623F0|nr:hypothetical protein OG519_07920 [Streptomyces sp. NBC_01190]